MGKVKSQLEAPFSEATVMALYLLSDSLSLSSSVAMPSYYRLRLQTVDLALTCSALASRGYSGDCSRMRVASGAVIFSLKLKCPVAGRDGLAIVTKACWKSHQVPFIVAEGILASDGW